MKNKNVLFTAAGVIIFLAAGMFTMFFSQTKNETKEVPVQNSISVPAVEIESSEAKIEIKNEKPKSDWYIYVTGEVKNPGYYKISPDTRIFNAVELAGGFTKNADITSINMAAPLVDGFHVNIEKKGTKKNIINNNARVKIPGVAQRPAPVTVNSQTQNIKVNNNSGLIDINNASAQELEKLNGVGPAIAKRIVEYRQKNGRFTSPEDLLKVRGIGNAKLEKMRHQILIR